MTTVLERVAQRLAEPRIDLSDYRDNPVGFVRDVLGEDPWDVQERIMRAVWSDRRVVVPSCYASGKTWVAARIVMAWTATHPGAIAISTASVDRQVTQCWNEIRKGAAKSKAPLPGRILPKSHQWDITPSNFAIGFSTDDPTKFQGWHGGRVLVVLDEAAAIGQPIWDAMEGQLATEDTAVLAIGNPVESAGPFYDAAQSDLWTTIPISVFDTPNYTRSEDSTEVRSQRDKELVSRHYAAERAQEWGEDSPLYQTKVLGQFPDAGEAIVIPLSWFLRAEKADPPPSDDGAVMGLDIARFGSDYSAIVIRKGQRVLHIERLHGADGVAVAGWATKAYRHFNCTTCNGDAGGVGGPVLDIMRANGLAVNDVQAGSAANDPEHFVRRRDEMWWAYRERFRTDTIGLARLPRQEVNRLRAESTALRYAYDLKGRVKVETKDEAAKRGIPSPDVADAACLAFATASTAMGFLSWMAPPCPNCGMPNQRGSVACQKCSQLL